MKHIGEHCRLPRIFLKRTGSVHLCDCGQLWTLQWMHDAWEPIKMWVKVDPTKLKVEK